MARYRKLFVAIVGGVALFVPEVAGMEGDFASVYDGVVAILTAFGVFRVPNEPASRAELKARL
jgi:uncharacterized membrane protein